MGQDNVIDEPLECRRKLLEDLLPVDLAAIVRSRTFEDGVALPALCKTLQLEGVVAKRVHSKYRPGMRSDDWLKVRTRYGRELIRERMENAHG